jgi:signal transduction histidine kinase
MGWPRIAVNSDQESDISALGKGCSSVVLIIASFATVVLALLVVLLALLVRLRRALRTAQADRQQERALADARAAELAHLADVIVPAIEEPLRAGRRPDGVPGPLDTAATGADFARHLARVIDTLGSDEALRRERSLRDSVQSAFETVARTMHAMATVQQQVLDRVERSLEDPALMTEVMKADHAAAQMTRKAQTLLVMCGIWPGRREVRPLSLYDCVRGAQSRIVEFGRIELHGGRSLHVVPAAVEGMMHALAELLENATAFSPSRTPVVVNIREVAAGAVVEIDDAGLGMPPDVLEQALAQLRDDVDLARLGAVPRLGLACVGRWCRELGFRMELSTASAYGGTRAVVFVPHALLTEPLADPGTTAAPAVAAVPRLAPVPTPGPAPAAPAGHPEPVGAGTPGASRPTAASAPSGLPRRRSRRGAPPASEAPPARVHRRPPATEGLPHPGESGGEAAAVDGAAPPADEVAPPASGHAPGRDPWTPQDARASISSVLSGVRRGRNGERPGQDAAPGDEAAPRRDAASGHDPVPGDEAPRRDAAPGHDPVPRHHDPVPGHDAAPRHDAAPGHDAVSGHDAAPVSGAAPVPDASSEEGRR